MPAYTRSAAAQAAYEAALRETRAAWYSVEDAIRVRVFGWDRTRGVDGRWIAIRMMGGQRRRVLEPNPYPYEVDNFLDRKAPAWVTGWTWQRNPPAARSVPGLWHVQVYFTR